MRFLILKNKTNKTYSCPVRYAIITFEMKVLTQDEIIDYCLTKNGAFLVYPFGEGVAVVKVRASRGPSRIFAQVFTLKGVPKATFNCDVLAAGFYRNVYPDSVARGYHCPPVQQPYFNTVNVESLPAEVIIEMIDLSYSTVLGKLPKYAKKELERE